MGFFVTAEKPLTVERFFSAGVVLRVVYASLSSHTGLNVPNIVILLHVHRLCRQKITFVEKKTRFSQNRIFS